MLRPPLKEGSPRFPISPARMPTHDNQARVACRLPEHPQLATIILMHLVLHPLTVPFQTTIRRHLVRLIETCEAGDNAVITPLRKLPGGFAAHASIWPCRDWQWAASCRLPSSVSGIVQSHPCRLIATLGNIVSRFPSFTDGAPVAIAFYICSLERVWDALTIKPLLRPI